MGFYGGSGLGRPGVRESKVVGVPTEVGIPIQQSIAIALGVAIVSFCIYLFCKIFITTRSDWSLLIGILTFASLPVSGYYFIKVLRRYFSSVIFDLSRREFIALWVVIFVFLGIVAEFYVSDIVPVITFTLNEQYHVVGFGCLLLGMIVALKPYLTFFTRQLTDSLRDSDSSYAQASLALEWEERNRKYQIIDQPIEYDDVPQIAAPQYTPLIRKTNVAILSAPTSEEERMDIAREEFLDGLRDGLFNTQERSWKGIRLVRSGYDLTAIGDRIRNDLLTDGWAEWQHPTKKNLGWKLLEEPDTIKARWLIKRTNNE